MQTTSTNGVTFVTTELLDFNESEGREITVYSRNTIISRTRILFSKENCKSQYSTVLKEKEVSFQIQVVIFTK